MGNNWQNRDRKVRNKRTDKYKNVNKIITDIISEF